MSNVKRALSGCVLLPILLIGSCCGKMSYDAWRYQLPGPVLASPAMPTQALDSPIQVADALDAYVQPRFEILRDKNFGAMRIVHRKHAGIVQLKVDTDEEKERIANVNAANRDYAISLLHCAPKPDHLAYRVTPKLQLLYFNQLQVAPDWDYNSASIHPEVEKTEKFDREGIENKAITLLPHLMAGKEHRMEYGSWAVLMRPVRAAKSECLSCHTNAKMGATLGVMVYAVRKITRNEITTAQKVVTTER